jgi:hypothetical protein
MKGNEKLTAERIFSYKAQLQLKFSAREQDNKQHHTKEGL